MLVLHAVLDQSGTSLGKVGRNGGADVAGKGLCIPTPVSPSPAPRKAQHDGKVLCGLGYWRADEIPVLNLINGV